MNDFLFTILETVVERYCIFIFVFLYLFLKLSNIRRCFLELKQFIHEKREQYMRDFMLVAHFSGLIIGAGTSFASLLLGVLSTKYDKERREQFLVSIFPLKYASNVGLSVLLISGLVLLSPYYNVLDQMLLAIIKLCLVATLILLSTYNVTLMRKVKAGEVSENLKKLALIGKISFAISVGIVFSAVYSFH